jgi:hypothetical protein
VGRSQKTFLTWSTQVLKAVSTQLEAVVTNKNTSDALIPRLDAKPHPRLRVLAVPIQSLDPSIFPNLPNLRILVLSPSTSPASAQSPPPLPFNPLSFAHFFTEHLPNLTHYIGPSTPNALLTALVAAPRRIQTLILDSPPYTYLPAHLLRQSRLEHFASSMAPPLHTYSSKLSGLMVLRPILSALPRPPTPSTPITRPWFPNPRDPSPVPCLCGNVLQDLRFRTNNSDLHLLSTIGPFVPNLRILSVWLDNGVPSVRYSFTGHPRSFLTRLEIVEYNPRVWPGPPLPPSSSTHLSTPRPSPRHSRQPSTRSTVEWRQQPTRYRS